MVVYIPLFRCAEKMLCYLLTDHMLSWSPYFCCAVFRHSVVCDSLWPHGLLCPGSSVLGDSPGQSTRVGCHVLLQGIFPTQESNPGLLHCRQVLYHLNHQGGPYSRWLDANWQRELPREDVKKPVRHNQPSQAWRAFSGSKHSINSKSQSSGLSSFLCTQSPLPVLPSRASRCRRKLSSSPGSEWSWEGIPGG